MEKPKPKYPVRKMLSYSDVIGYIEEKYNIKDVRDYAGSHNQRKDFEKATGINLRCNFDCPGSRKRCWKGNEMIDCSDEEYESAKQDYYNRCNKFNDWKKRVGEKPYQDFWHWFGEDNYETINGGIMYFSFHKKEKPTPEWVQEILDMVKKEFGKYMEEESIPVWVEW